MLLPQFPYEDKGQITMTMSKIPHVHVYVVINFLFVIRVILLQVQYINVMYFIFAVSVLQDTYRKYIQLFSELIQIYSLEKRALGNNIIPQNSKTFKDSTFISSQVLVFETH